ncbi:MAG: hypothetical protein WKG52_06020 [Variovorax sp.]
MKLLTSLPLAFVLAGCGIPPNQAVPVRDGVLRAPTYADAIAHCERAGATATMLGKAPAESGVLFRCEAAGGR